MNYEYKQQQINKHEQILYYSDIQSLLKLES